MAAIANSMVEGIKRRLSSCIDITRLFLFFFPLRDLRKGASIQLVSLNTLKYTSLTYRTSSFPNQPFPTSRYRKRRKYHKSASLFSFSVPIPPFQPHSRTPLNLSLFLTTCIYYYHSHGTSPPRPVLISFFWVSSSQELRRAEKEETGGHRFKTF